MRPAWRVIDTGVRSAAENFALNRSLLESRRLGECPSTLRFLQFRPSALLGYHQSAEQELDLDYCAEQGIAVQRRITGGGAIYMDEGQFGWELYLSRADAGSADMSVITRRICEAAARGLSTLGLAAQFRPRNDIEVGGRKISGTGGAFDGDALLYQGTVLVDFDVARMVRCLRIPSQKIADKAIADARERVVSLRELLGQAPPPEAVKARIQDAFSEAFAVDFLAGELLPAEVSRCGTALEEIDTEEWVHLVRKPRAELPLLEAVQKFSGGMVRVAIAWERQSDRIRQIWFTGDFFVSPRRTVADLEAALKDLPLAQAAARIEDFFAGRAVDMLTLRPADFSAAIATAAEAGRRGEKG